MGSIGLKKGASMQGLLMQGGKVALGATLSSTATRMAQNFVPGIGDEIASIGIGFAVAKYLDKDIGIGIAVGGVSSIVQGAVGGFLGG